MADMTPSDRLDRHALVMAVWTPLIFVTVALLQKGVSDGGSWWIAAGFVVLLIAFVSHIIINAATRTVFTPGETALGMFGFAVGMAVLLLGALFGQPGFAEGILLPVGLGMVSLVVAVVAYLVIAHGPRRAFERFDVIRDNNLRAASRLPHRGGRR